jgi:segregation and condensation protein B
MEPDDDLSEVEGDASRRLMSIVESLLFAATTPMTVLDIRKILKEPSVRQIQLAVKQLIAESAERGVVVGQVAGGFRLRTHPENARWVQQMLAGKPVRLSRSQLEALAVIAYRQPITKAEIDHIRGVDCSAVLKLLLERDLARIVGRKEEPGRPHLYGTTVAFLEFFNLRSLRDMPDLHEFRELTEESQATLREQLGEEAAELAQEREALGQEVLHFDDRVEDEAVVAREAVADEALVAEDEALVEPSS